MYLLYARVLPWRGLRGFSMVPLCWLAWLPHFRLWSGMEGRCCPLYRPMDYSRQTWEQCLLIGTVPSHRTVVADVALNHLSGEGVQGSREG
jgi:hypothetical protein